MTLKKLFLSIHLLVFLLLLPDDLPASHNQGQDITYTCLSNCVIRIELRGYRSCAGQIPMSNTINFTPLSPGCPQPNPVSAMSAQQTVEVTQVCPGQLTNCTQPGAPINGVQEYYWFRDFDICNAPNCIYSISWGQCCRNTNITSGAPGNIFTNATTLNTGVLPCNSSPQFSNVPVPYICAGQPYTFNQGATDPDGDVLVYSLNTCYTGPNQPFAYNPGYSPQQPLGQGWNVVLDPSTGDIFFDPVPGPIEVAVICVYIEEWRNGQLINTIVRDMQVNVLPCTNTVPSMPGITNLSAGTQTGPFAFTICAGVPFSFDLPVVDPDNGQIHTVTWNNNIPGLSFSSGSQVNTIVGPTPTVNVSWSAASPGVYTFLATALDDNCPVLGSTQNTIVITVTGGLPGASMTATPVGCSNVSLSANPGTASTGPYSFQWSGDGNLNLNPNAASPSLTHTYPGPGNYAVQLQITDGFGCGVTLYDTVQIVAGPTADAGPDISLCSGYPVNLGSNSLPPGQNYTWSPSTGLSNPNSPNPTLNYALIGSQPQTITYTMTATSGFCTSIDYVTVTVNPTPTAVISGPQSICNGQSATLTASGGGSYLWSTIAVSPSITVSPTSTTTYSVVASANGCSSPPVMHTLNVSDGPVAAITGPDSVCPGESVFLTASGGDSWQWSTGAVTQSITVNGIQSDTTVYVTASDNGCPGAPTGFTIHPHARPDAHFAFTTVCFGEATAFTDRSGIPTGSLIAWEWDFDDAATGTANFSTERNPVHQFSAPGYFNVQLTVTGSNGCKDVVTWQVLVHALPVVDFEAPNVCEGEATAFFDQSTADAAIVSWLWDFGGGATSTQENPVHTFVPGTHNVLLTVTDANGCRNSRERTVIVHPAPTADFYFSRHCFNTEAQFFSTASLSDPLGTVIAEHHWNFGDPASGAANTSTQTNPSHVWASGPRTYLVTLTVSTSRGCSHSVSYPVEVPVVPRLEVRHDSICRGFSAELEVLNSVAGTTIEWFHTPDGTDPFLTGSSTYTTPPLNVTTHYYVAMRDADGCLSPKTGVVAHVHPEANVSVDVSSNVVEIPHAMVEFNVTDVYNGPLIRHVWDFGDGTTSDLLNPVHQYTQSGTYDVSLHLLNAWGCESTQVWTKYILVNKPVDILIPTAFSPNGDGLNDVFNVFTRLITDFRISIYDRWGKLIFASDNPGFEWAGTDASGQALPEGAYVYVVQARDWEGVKIERAGSVTLLR